MSQPFDLSQFPDLPPEVVKAFEAQQFELAVERAARLHHQTEAAPPYAREARFYFLVLFRKSLNGAAHSTTHGADGARLTSGE